MQKSIRDVDLRYFVEVGTLGNLSKAADKLGITGSALSQRITLLEERVAQKLFHRDGRGVRLTAQGQDLWETLRHSFGQIDAMVSDLADGSHASASWVSIATVQSVMRYFLGPVLAEFARLSPGSRFILNGRPTQDIVASVEAGHADFGIGYGEQILSPTVSSEFLFLERYCFVHSETFTEIAGSGLQLLQRAPLILPPPKYGLRTVAERALGSLNVRCEVTSFEEIVTLARCGLGIGLVPEPVANSLAAVLRRIEIDIPLSRQIMLITRTEKPSTRAKENLLSLVRERAQALSR